MQSSTSCVPILSIAILTLTYPLVAQENKEIPLNQTEQIAKKYHDTLQQNGIPTPALVDLAFNKAKETSTVENWKQAAQLANSYANVVNVLSEHYYSVYRQTVSSSYPEGHTDYLHTSISYEKKKNVYLAKRNAAYLELAKIYLQEGDKANALSYAVTAVCLQSNKPNTEGEQLIRKIIEYQP